MLGTSRGCTRVGGHSRVESRLAAARREAIAFPPASPRAHCAFHPIIITAIETADLAGAAGTQLALIYGTSGVR